ncbi:hypothetical protein DVH24_006210 [Malus domestica]|uniref:Uncharacterized protein n=1 Tax=Malus domestica TaxID=3750 RepID=A0A498KHI9_MALDO|nr:hypothetical protein DVH24_006210 [Malus domestica]
MDIYFKDVSLLIALLKIAAYRTYSADTKEKENRLRIERFLYSYADIKRITNQFKDKLGQEPMELSSKECSLLNSLLLSKSSNSSKGDGADRKEKENRLRIERFLDDYKSFKPSRYSYADSKRITNQFKDRLDQEPMELSSKERSC